MWQLSQLLPLHWAGWAVAVAPIHAIINVRTLAEEEVITEKWKESTLATLTTGIYIVRMLNFTSNSFLTLSGHHPFRGYRRGLHLAAIAKQNLGCDQHDPDTMVLEPYIFGSRRKHRTVPVRVFGANKWRDKRKSATARTAHREPAQRET
jgi:hypothetical protein